MTTRLLSLDDYRERRLEQTAAPMVCVQGEARPGLIVIHVPEGWTTVEMSPAKARVWLDHLTTLIESAEAMERAPNHER